MNSIPRTQAEIRRSFIEFFASKGHTPMMVPLFAYGPRSGEFGCIQENSDVANKILQIFGVKK